MCSQQGRTSPVGTESPSSLRRTPAPQVAPCGEAAIESRGEDGLVSSENAPPLGQGLAQLAWRLSGRVVAGLRPAAPCVLTRTVPPRTPLPRLVAPPPPRRPPISRPRH